MDFPNLFPLLKHHLCLQNNWKTVKSRLLALTNQYFKSQKTFPIHID